MHRPIAITFTFAFTLACTSGPSADDEAGTTTSQSTDDDTSSDESTETTTSTSTSEDDDESTASTDDGLDTGVFLPFDDVPDLGCDMLVQDCPQGEKCVPFATTDDSQTLDGLKCVPVMGDHATGEACTHDGVVEATDDCDATNWCFDLEGDGSGVCHAFCTGTQQMPECPPMSECSIAGEGVIVICIPTCDPILQDCAEPSDGCYWTGTTFNCIPEDDNVPTGEACGFLNDCAEGNMCVDASYLPSCAGDGCCTLYCDLELGDSQCAALPGTACVPFFEQGDAPPEYEHVGVCIEP